jgi:phosphomevalonate kinase
MASAVALSAPGKVLLAGGYLVLDRKHTGLVFGLDARIHVAVEHLSTCDGLTPSEFIVRSPQFRDAEWRYGYREIEDNGGIEVIQLSR